ncbi:MAG: 1,4-dihydroxy-2-naphthoate polyprenyltransferase [Myxococcota bacterium]|nr:1,4-dihydroxy-2-naphthoate polyprenyltransferase [Myxococcota bacterium]
MSGELNVSSPVVVAAPSLKTWLLAIRPRTLTAAIVPVMIGSALAFGDGRGQWLPAVAALLGALLIQIGTNLTNDYYDFKKGADTHERLGPVRVTQAGLISPQTVLLAAVASFAAALVIGLYLVAVAGWPVVLIGMASLLSGYAYTGGPYPLAYNGLGDVFVFVFFGFVAVGGTYFVQALGLPPKALLAAVPVGALGTAILVVNNLRDATTDVKAGKRTLIVRFGERAGRGEYLACLALAFGTPLVLRLLGWEGWAVLLPLAAAPFAVAPLRRVLQQRGAALNPGLGETAKLQLVFGALFAAGLYLG